MRGRPETVKIKSLKETLANGDTRTYAEIAPLYDTNPAYVAKIARELGLIRTRGRRPTVRATVDVVAA